MTWKRFSFQEIDITGVTMPITKHNFIVKVSLLASSEMTVAEIAYEVGFSSPSYFTKCYKEQFGESPTDFLKRKNL